MAGDRPELVIYKRGRGVKHGTTEKQLQLAAKTGLELGTSGFQVRRPNPLNHAASHYSVIPTNVFPIIIDS